MSIADAIFILIDSDFVKLLTINLKGKKQNYIEIWHISAIHLTAHMEYYGHLPSINSTLPCFITGG